MNILPGIKALYPDVEIHWFTKRQFVDLVGSHPLVNRVWALEKEDGLKGLITKGIELNKEKFCYHYDAHCNIRTLVLGRLIKSKHCVRSKERGKRGLLFFLGINTMPSPFVGAESYRAPLLKDFDLPPLAPADLNLPEVEYDVEKCWALAPSAAWEMKRWPVEYWKELIEINKNEKFVVLGGPEDHFCQQLESIDPQRVINLAGKLSLLESATVVNRARGLISADTGLIHVADLLGKKGILLLGPTAFGRTFSPRIKIVEKELDCRPCTKDGRGQCINQQPLKCMRDLLPEQVSQVMHHLARE